MKFRRNFRIRKISKIYLFKLYFFGKFFIQGCFRHSVSISKSRSRVIFSSSSCDDFSGFARTFASSQFEESPFSQEYVSSRSDSSAFCNHAENLTVLYVRWVDFYLESFVLSMVHLERSFLVHLNLVLLVLE